MAVALLKPLLHVPCVWYRAYMNLWLCFGYEVLGVLRACNHGGVGGFIYKLLIKVGRAEWDARKGVRAKAGTSRWFEALWVCTEVVLEKWILLTPVRSAKTWCFISLFSLTFHVGALLVFLLLVKGGQTSQFLHACSSLRLLLFSRHFGHIFSEATLRDV